MKRTTIAILCCLAVLSILSSLVYAQRRLSRSAIDVKGVKLRLGMSKSEVSEKLVGNEITKTDEDDWMVAASGELGPSLEFTDGRLSFADRYWVTYDNDISEALYGAVTSLNQEGLPACTVNTDIKTDPDSSLHRLWILCGEKSIVMVHNMTHARTFNTVHEQLGRMR